MSGNLAFIDAFVRQIETQGANALPVFHLVAQGSRGTAGAGLPGSDAGRRPSISSLTAEAPIIDAVIMTMSFSMGDINAGGTTPAGWGVETLRALDLPVLQAITCSTSRWQWEASARGLNPLDTAMNVALPEFDGRIITVPVSFKERPPRRNANRDVQRRRRTCAGDRRPHQAMTI